MGDKSRNHSPHPQRAGRGRGVTQGLCVSHQHPRGPNAQQRQPVTPQTRSCFISLPLPSYQPPQSLSMTSNRSFLMPVFHLGLLPMMHSPPRSQGDPSQDQTCPSSTATWSPWVFPLLSSLTWPTGPYTLTPFFLPTSSPRSLPHLAHPSPDVPAFAPLHVLTGFRTLGARPLPMNGVHCFSSTPSSPCPSVRTQTQCHCLKEVFHDSPSSNGPHYPFSCAFHSSLT